ncbi:hypothetical protein BHM03_00006061 [Ensete ventricosum]|nr:hypothetical protein BHM03_00006061 [Ensete ventricosum]
MLSAKQQSQGRHSLRDVVDLQGGSSAPTPFSITWRHGPGHSDPGVLLAFVQRPRAHAGCAKPRKFCRNPRSLHGAHQPSPDHSWDAPNDYSLHPSTHLAIGPSAPGYSPTFARGGVVTQRTPDNLNRLQP